MKETLRPGFTDGLGLDLRKGMLFSSQMDTFRSVYAGY
jgi:hypothetical protein